MMYVAPDKTIKVAVSQSLESKTFEFNDFSDYLIPNSEDPTCLDPVPGDSISDPHSNSFLDLNGDCVPDIFMQKVKTYTQGNSTMVEPYYEVYTQKLVGEGANKQGKFCLLHSG